MNLESISPLPPPQLKIGNGTSRWSELVAIGSSSGGANSEIYQDDGISIPSYDSIFKIGNRNGGAQIKFSEVYLTPDGTGPTYLGTDSDPWFNISTSIFATQMIRSPDSTGDILLYNSLVPNSYTSNLGSDSSRFGSIYFSGTLDGDGGGTMNVSIGNISQLSCSSIQARYGSDTTLVSTLIPGDSTTSFGKSDNAFWNMCAYNIYTNNIYSISSNINLSTDLIPDTNNSRSIGSFTTKLKYLYSNSAIVSGNLGVGSLRQSSNALGGSITLGSDLVPNATTTRNLGSSTLKFNNIYTNTIYCYNAVSAAAIGVPSGSSISLNVDMIPDTEATHDLGDFPHPFNHGYFDSIYIHNIGTLGTYGNTSSTDIRCSDNFLPGTTSTSTTSGVSLGSASYRWRYLYAYSGTIQTSSKDSKHDIQYIKYQTSSTAKKARSTTSQTMISYEDIAEFINLLQPATFTYDGPDDEQESVQIGLIAEDLIDSNLYKYIGVDIDSTIKDEETGETTVVNTKGLKILPVAVTALTACKYLLDKINNLESKLSEILTN